MKIHYFIFFLFAYSTISAQEYIKLDSVTKEFYYEYKFHPDSTNINKQESQEMVLQIGKKHSKFTPVNRLYMDSLLFSVRNMDKQAAFKTIMPHISHSGVSSFCSYRLLKNYPQKGRYELWGNFGGDIHLTERGTLKPNWKIETTKQTTILGYKCYKATCHFAGRDYEAWFTPDIPISDGPYKFSGLPGLILSVVDTKNQHSFHIYKVKDKPRRAIFLYLSKEDYKTADAKQYVKAFYLRNARFARQFGGNNPNVRFDSDDSKASFLHKLNCNNNYIEKYP